MSDEIEGGESSSDTGEVSRQELIEFLGDFMSGTMRIEQVYRSHLCSTLVQRVHSEFGPEGLAEMMIKIDCDVLQADGGTRTASITGAWGALHIALSGMLKDGLVEKMPLNDHVGAVSCGLYKGEAVLDLDYAEDSNAQADANFVLTGNGGIVEIQGTAEEDPFTRDQFNRLLELAEQGIGDLVGLQKQAIGG